MDENILFGMQDESQGDEEITLNVDSEKYLLFKSGGLLFGVRAQDVVEILTTLSIRKIPLVPNYIPGIINLRGQIIPIADVRVILEQDSSGDDCAIIFNIDETPVGALVDSVERMIDVVKDDIQILSDSTTQKLVCGMCALPDGSTMLVFDASKLYMD